MGRKYFRFSIGLSQVLITALLLLLCFASSGVARARPVPKPYAVGKPAVYPGVTCPNSGYVNLDIGNIRTILTNLGVNGGVMLPSLVDITWTEFSDPLIGYNPDPLIAYDYEATCEFPKGSRLGYLWDWGYWIGAIVGRDTLVSVTGDEEWYVHEFWPDPAPGGAIVEKSMDLGSRHYSEDAMSEQDFAFACTDILTDQNYVTKDARDDRPHIPLNIELTQKSYVWTYDYARDFIIFDCRIKNVGRKTLRQVYIGIFADPWIGYTGFVPYPPLDTIEYGGSVCGFMKVYPAPGCLGNEDTLNVAYAVDASGDPRLWPPPVGFFRRSPRGAVGIKLISIPSESFNYNWWVTAWGPGDIWPDFGPRQAGTSDDPFKDFGRDPYNIRWRALGTPYGDANKYYIMKHPEIDYDQITTRSDHTAEGWLPPPDSAREISGRAGTFLLSFGSVDLYPGAEVPFTYALVLGDNVHKNWRNWRDNLRDTYRPDEYMRNLDFAEFAANARWSGWVYDNPNYDTDGDGYFGNYRICCTDSLLQIDSSVTPPEITYLCLKSDTTFYTGDGFPDLRAATPPPPPKIRVTPGLDEFNSGRIVIHWNGYRSERTKDVFSNTYDFEGYRVYQSLSPAKKDFVLVSSYDKEDYNQWIFDWEAARWILSADPLSLDTLRSLYGNNFQPLNYPRDRPLVVTQPGSPATSYYFTRQDWNTSDLNDTTKIHKRFPDQPYPSTLNLDSAAIYFPEELTEEGQFKYFEYEYVMRRLLPSRLYYITVTAFDYGSAGLGIVALETNPTVNMVKTYAQNTAAAVEERGLKVVVYPNPYRADGHYRSMQGGGFEGRGQEDLHDQRVRAIHFANLPHRCTIRIFSIDGDLIREIRHDFPPDSPESGHDIWDVITRNTQEPVSGIYYYVIESEYGNQIGNLVLIM